MGIFNKVSGWLADKGDRFIRGGSEHESGYYTSQEARDAYSAQESQAMSDEVGEQSERRPALDPFKRGGDGEYGGRVPYRSKYDLEMEAYQQAQQQQAAMQQSGRMQPVTAAVQQAMQPQAPMQAQQTAPVQPRQAAAQAVYPQAYAPVNNVVPFPGMQRGPDGMVYAHVEYIVLLRSRNECKDVIGYIKTSASVFLNMEFIASDSERQRCVDMLSGAAYTLGCALNKISPRGIYLISSPTVKVVLDPAIQKFSAAPEAQGFARQRYDQESYGGYEQQPVQQRAAASYEQPVQQRAAVGYEQPMPPAQQPTPFAMESPTARFQAQGTQRTRPMSFSAAVAGSYAAASMSGGQSNTGRYRAVDYPQ